MKKRLKINGLIMFLAVLLTGFFPSLFLRHAGTSSLDDAVEIFGVGCILLGQLFRVSARGYKSERSKEGQQLVEGGPYSLVRNPMYLGIFLIGLGVVCVLFNWWVTLLFLVVFIIRYALLIFKEEKRLLAVFGSAYAAYMRRVPRIVPGFTTLADRDISEYLPLKAHWIKKEIGSILALLLSVAFLESWEDIKGEGLDAYFREAAVMLATAILFTGLALYLYKRQKEVQT